MNLIVLDTETTGLDAAQGHRVIELGCVLLSHRKHTDMRFHTYLNPKHPIDPEAQEVHGITENFLEGKPSFPEMMDKFLDFVRGSELVIHNAPFDLGFLNQELELAGNPSRLEDICEITDSLELARQMHPGQRNSLDALCRRYNVDNSGRELHGALLDAEILADVYLAMTGGQTALALEGGASKDTGIGAGAARQHDDVQFPVIRANEEELVEHRRWLELLDPQSPWHNIDQADDLH
ncbi:MAG TPA: DNA polymerase III subunit epsilon [Gammaproteobacteria bacterium]|jgi:DNA polymerase-3 subunit epsilon|nr:DNA polymerase III subunit epsilon [Acidiferrobacteraceae bacterium]MDP6552385.1 DNA polymerase III subunit epsilon [Arenicellales bacterium]MDP6790328.1 DNA polymerase III subunit epsilon [Arenicellales bacterium]MDP6918198.1 DNA polymerase III subunit epsilon [Arenicellales bacterium]HCX88367.1 DNA polymerase III subunit epsilon [Gammaproteobacteria bacterium]|tara:strand:+ start:19638 stop:20348 length:711 start_codon:yes stop_codon:yes gene_type:complete